MRERTHMIELGNHNKLCLLIWIPMGLIKRLYIATYYLSHYY